MGLNEKTYVFYVDVNQIFRGQLEPILVTVQGECPLGENGDREDMITARAWKLWLEPCCYTSPVPTTALLPWLLAKTGASVALPLRLPPIGF